MKSFRRNIQGKALHFEMQGEALLLKQLESDLPHARLIHKYQIKELPESFSLFFGDLNELFQELQVVEEEKLQFSNDGQLVYHMATARKIVKLTLSLERLALSQSERMGAQILQLTNQIARLKNALQQKCKENESCLHTIDALKLKISELLLMEKPLSNGNESNGQKNGLKRCSPAGACWDEPVRKKRKASEEEERPIECLQKFNFQPDTDHPNTAYFKWQKSVLKFVGNSSGEYRRVTSSDPIERHGRTSLEVKLVRGSFNGILFGLIREEDRYIPFEREQGQAVSLCLKQGLVFLKGQGGLCEVYEGKLKKGDTIQLVVNREKSQMFLYHNSHTVAQFSVKLPISSDYYAFVCMSSKGEELEFM